MAGSKLFNFVRQSSSSNFREVVPEATDTNIESIKNILFNDAYAPLLNEFVGNLINRIGLTIIRNKAFSNPLSILKKGSQPLGTDIQDIYTNPAEAEQYQLSNGEMAKLLTINDPDTKVAYYRRNRKDMYTKTLAREALMGAFDSWNRFESYLTSVTQALSSAAYIDEFKHTKGLVAGAYKENKIPVKVVSEVNSEATAKAFVKECQNLYRLMKFPSSDYNAYSLNTGETNKPVVTWTEPERIIVMIRSDVLTEVGVESLAYAFNMDKANFMGRVIEVDKFDEEGKVKAIVADEALFQIYDNIFRFDEFYNARVMAWNYYLHVWQTFAICPFANATILATEAPTVSATAVSVLPETATAVAGGAVALHANTTPVNATSEVTYAVTGHPSGGANADITVASTNNGRDAIASVGAGATAGEYTITATSNAHTDTMTITITA